MLLPFTYTCRKNAVNVPFQKVFSANVQQTWVLTLLFLLSMLFILLFLFM